MLKSVCIAAVLFSTLSFAAGIPPRTITGTYIEARTADIFTGPCFANGEVEMAGKEAVFGWKINSGKWQGVDLQGLSVVGVVRAEHTLGNVYEPINAMRAVLILDSHATAEQQAALRSFALKAGGDLFKNIVKVDNAPIEFTVQDDNIHSAVAKLSAGSLAAIKTRAIMAADHTCGNEDAFYPPLNDLDHAMPAYALEDVYQGGGLGETWKNGPRRSSFLGTFHLTTD
ncbi:MAG TPA: DUF1326 domain-containing protein [Candidatus Sulfopaludibacter sp.]|jgi:hypothetical protein|nr:DUF1326 domain-containing protein [Candidatus Sulfopaludibacter sp.]